MNYFSQNRIQLALKYKYKQTHQIERNYNNQIVNRKVNQSFQINVINKNAYKASNLVQPKQSNNQNDEFGIKNIGSYQFKSQFNSPKKDDQQPRRIAKKQQNKLEEIKKGKVSPMNPVPAHILLPEYALTGKPRMEEQSIYQSVIKVNSEGDIQKMRRAGTLTREVLDYAHGLVLVGSTTDQIDKLVHDFIISKDAYPSPLNYKHFPKSICTSVNQVICHGIPDDRKLLAGDIINIDVSVYTKEGVHGDISETYIVAGNDKSTCNQDDLFLIEHTYRCLEKAITLVRPGMQFKKIGEVIEDYIVPLQLSIVEGFCGHGINEFFHTAPDIYHYRGSPFNGRMEVGHIFTIEPMINFGSKHCKMWNDDWTILTKDGRKSAQFEHTVLVTPDGCEVLTKRTMNSPKLSFNI